MMVARRQLIAHPATASKPALSESERPTQPEAPRLLVLSQLFPSAAQPNAGLFIRERMFRVGRHLPIVIVAPQPWFPFQGLIRLWRPHFRPSAVKYEVQNGVHVHRPRFLCFPGVLKQTDGLLMALSCWWLVRRLCRVHQVDVIDAHFAYPDGYAATLLAKWLRLPVSITLRGKEERQSRTPVKAPLLRALQTANKLICVSEALRQFAISSGASPDKAVVIGNGVDLEKFHPVPKPDARRQLGLPSECQALISVGGLVGRKGFHRVIDCLCTLLPRFPNLHYLIVGGASPEGDISEQLHRQVATLGLTDRVHFLGPVSPDHLKVAYSAADVFVLATSYEGWANVFLEAMACGLPVVTTRVGGNAEVVQTSELGTLVAFGDSYALSAAIDGALRKQWDRHRIIAYAQANSWDARVTQLLEEFSQLVSGKARSDTASKVHFGAL
jgi:teichuronic acid biosynthesis glycosyltransferase TuaC